MAFQKFLIAPFNSGLVNNVKPFLIPDDAFEALDNAYVYRGRTRKRFGSYLMNTGHAVGVQQLYSRLRIDLGDTGASPSTHNLPAGANQLALGQMFSIGDAIFTVYQLGAGVATYSTSGSISATIDSTVSPNTVTFTGVGTGNAVYWYPARPVMGIFNFENEDVNAEETFAFDTTFAYTFDGTGWERLGTAAWTGTDSQFFWGLNYRSSVAYQTFFFVVNYNAADLIKYWDGSAWNNLQPAINAGGDTLDSARLIVSFKDRFIALNTKETISSSSRTFVNRARYSQVGSPLDATAFREDTPGRGGFLDAPTREAIITAEFVKDRLIVYFERSTWELVYLNNESFPFTWQQINAELGAESTNSIVPFDKVALGVGQVGVHACNGANVERIDEKIPDEVFKIHNGNQGVERVAGIRDYNTELVYWAIPDFRTNPTYPNRVLVFNYATGSWAFNDDSFTAFGYYQPSNDLTWADATFTWESSDASWNSGQFQSQYQKILAGNQEGFMLVIDPDSARNAPSLQITNMSVSGSIVTLTVYKHNLQEGEYVAIENVLGLSGLSRTIYQVYDVVSADSFTIRQSGVTGSYTGAGTIARVSRIQILSKQYNFFAESARNLFVSKIEFMVDRTDSGEFTVDYSPSSSDLGTLTLAEAAGSLLGTGVVETTPYDLVPLEAFQSRLWHPLYLQNEGNVIQLKIYLSDEQMIDENIAWSDFELHAMMFYATPTSRLE